MERAEDPWRINIQADYDIEVEHDTHEDDLNRVASLVSWGLLEERRFAARRPPETA